MAKKMLTLKQGKYWTKKIRGKVHYFGTDYATAVEEYKARRPFLEAGVEIAEGGATLADLLNAFLSEKRSLLREGRMSQRTYDDYEEVCDIIAATVPKKSILKALEVEHFVAVRRAISRGVEQKTIALKSQDRKLGYARAVFRFASVDNFLIDRDLPYRRALVGISKLEMRRYRASQPERSLSAADINRVLEIASPVLKVSVLLALNGGLNNSDVKQLTMKVATPKSGVMTYPRRKTFFKRVTPLWPETRAAIDEAIRVRPKPKPKSDLLLISPSGVSYLETKKEYPISRFFTDALKKIDAHAAGKNFGALRTMFAEIGKEVGDDVALKAAMGHSDGSQLYESYADGVYIPRIKKITDHVHAWLFDN